MAEPPRDHPTPDLVTWAAPALHALLGEAPPHDDPVALLVHREAGLLPAGLWAQQVPADRAWWVLTDEMGSVLTFLAAVPRTRGAFALERLATTPPAGHCWLIVAAERTQVVPFPLAG